MEPTKELTKWIVEASLRDFPSDAVETTKGLLLKVVTGMVVGCREPIGRKLTPYLAAAGGTPEAGIVGAGFRTSVENAALAHGTFAHASEFEDDRFPDPVGTFWIFPAFFALGEKLTSSGREILEAAIVSFEVTSRLCSAAPGSLMVEKTRIMTPTWFGIMGVAAGASRLMNLSAEETTNALGIAASHSSGIWASLGSDAHFLESGHCCRSGVLSAILAKAGATGSPLFLESRGGLYGPIIDEGKVDLGIITKGLGEPPFQVSEVWVKKFPCCFATHAPIDALIALMKDHDVKYEEVETVRAEIDRQCAVAVDRCATSLEAARFSLYYCLAEVLLEGSVKLGSFAKAERLVNPKIVEAQGKVKLIVPLEWSTHTHQARVTLVMKDGRKYTKHLAQPIGSPKYPLTTEQVADVCRHCLDAMLKEKQRRRVEEILLDLDEEVDIRELMGILTYCRCRVCGPTLIR